MYEHSVSSSRLKGDPHSEFQGRAEVKGEPVKREPVKGEQVKGEPVKGKPVNWRLSAELEEEEL